MSRLLSSATLFALLAFGSSLLAEEQPNIVLIMADDVGADAIGCYGGESFATPNIDRLAADGLRFEHCFSMPSCHPTRVCLLTGRYPHSIGNPKWGSFPDQLEGRTIASRLRSAGYATCVAGKWQLTLLGKDLRQPNRMGFDNYSLFGWHEGPRYYQPLVWQNGEARKNVAEQYGPDVYSDYLIEFIRREAAAGPFFAYFPMALCHDVTDDLKEPTPYGPRGRYDSFAEMMVQLDRVVGKVATAVRELETKRPTLILFTGDNGTAARSIIRHERGKYIRDKVFVEYKGQRVQGGKTRLTDGGTHVPLIATWIDRRNKGTRSATLVDFSDFFPTLCELAGVSHKSEKIDGVSFAADLLGTGNSTRRFAYAEAKGRYFVRDQRWKLYNDQKFFDVSEDRAEKFPLGDKALSPEARAAKARLHKALATFPRR